MFSSNPLSSSTQSNSCCSLSKGEQVNRLLWVTEELWERAALKFSKRGTIPCKVEILSSDPEYALVLAYYNRHKPPCMRITRVFYHFNLETRKMFREKITGCDTNEVSASSLVKNWKHFAESFSSLHPDIASKIDLINQTKIIPVWVKGAKLSFGSHRIRQHPDPQALCTDNAHYAALHSQGMLLLSVAVSNCLSQNGEGEFTKINQTDLLPLYSVKLAIDPTELARPLSLPGVEDIEGHYYQCFQNAYQKGVAIDQIFYLENLALIFLSKGKYTESAQLINTAYQIACTNEEAHKSKLIAFLEHIERTFWTQSLKIVLPERYQNNILQRRSQLHGIRENARNQLKRKNAAGYIQFILTTSIRNMLIGLIEDCISALGPVPTEYAVFGLGSMGRGEMCPYSDVEFGFLIADGTEVNKDYFRRLSQAVEFKVLLMGETKFKIIRQHRMEKSLLPGGFSMDIGGLSPRGKSGVYELIGTPIELARFLNEGWLSYNEAETILANAMAAPCFVTGNEGLVSQYRQLVQSHMNQKINRLEWRKQRALTLLQGHLNEFSPNLEEELKQSAINVKKNLYRPFQMILETLALYHSLKGLASNERIDELKNLKLISTEGAENLRKAFDCALRLRLELQLFFGEENETMSRNPENEGSNWFPIGEEQTNQLVEIYRTMVPFHEAAIDFVKGKQKAFEKSPFYSTKLGKGQQRSIDPHGALLLEEAAGVRITPQDYLQNAALKNDPNALVKVALYELRNGRPEQALQYINEALKELTIDGKLTHSNQTMSCFVGLGEIYTEMGEYQPARKYLQYALKLGDKLLGTRSFGKIVDNLDSLHWANILQARALEMLGLICCVEYDPDFRRSAAEQGKKYLEEAILSIKGHDPHNFRVDSRLNLCQGALGKLYEAIGDRKNALKCYGKGAKSFMKWGYWTKEREHFNACQSRMKKSEVLPPRANLTELLKIWKDQMNIYQNIPSVRLTSLMYYIGRAYRQEHQPKDALKCFHDALDLLTSAHSDKPHPLKCYCLLALGTCYLEECKEYRIAINLLQQGLAMYQLLFKGPHVTIVRTLARLATAYIELDQPGQAMEHLQKALRMHRKLIKLSDKSMTEKKKPFNWMSLGMLYFKTVTNLEKMLVLPEYKDDSDSSSSSESTSETDSSTEKSSFDVESEVSEKTDSESEDDSSDFEGVKKVAAEIGSQLMQIYGQNLVGFRQTSKSWEQIEIECLNQSELLFLHCDLMQTYLEMNLAEEATKIGMNCIENILSQQDLELLEKYIDEDLETSREKPSQELLVYLAVTGRSNAIAQEGKLSIDVLKTAFSIQKSLHGATPNSWQGIILRDMGRAYWVLKQESLAIESLHQALKSFDIVFGANSHRLKASCLELLGEIYKESGNQQEALKYFELALSMRVDLYGNSEHPYLVRVRDQVREIQKILPEV